MLHKSFFLLLSGAFLLHPNKFFGQVNSTNRNLTKIIQKASADIPSLGSMLIAQHGQTLQESYLHGATDTTVFSIKSVTKSIVSTLTGIAADKGILPLLDTPVYTLFPEFSDSLPPNPWYPDFIARNDSFRKMLTIRHLLTMQGGFNWDDNNSLSHQSFMCATDPVRYMLELPFSSPPGTQFGYCTGGTHVLGAIVAKSAQTTLRAFADSVLFGPAGMTVADWTTDHQGRNAGGSEMYMTPQNMLRFGLLIQNKGKMNGQQIISEKWISAATGAQVPLDYWDVLPNANGYGYCWWRRMVYKHQAYVASGYGGQLICIIPDMELVIVTTCFVNDLNRGRSEIKRLHGYIDQVVKKLEE